MHAQLRDLRAIYTKMLQVLRPTSGNAVLREWDLWGPLLFTTTLAILLSLDAPPAQSLSVFTGIFAIVSIGSVVVTLNCKLLGGKVYVQQYAGRSALIVFVQLLPPISLCTGLLPLPAGRSGSSSDIHPHTMDPHTHSPRRLCLEYLR